MVVPDTDPVLDSVEDAVALGVADIDGETDSLGDWLEV